MCHSPPHPTLLQRKEKEGLKSPRSWVLSALLKTLERVEVLRIWLECHRNALLLGMDRPTCCRFYQDSSGHCTHSCASAVLRGKNWLRQIGLKRKHVTKPAVKCSLISVTRCKISTVTFIAGMVPDLFCCPALGINSVFIWTPDVHGLLRVFEGFSGMQNEVLHVLIAGKLQ